MTQDFETTTVSDSSDKSVKTRFSIRSRRTSNGKIRTEAIVNKGEDALLRAAISLNPKTKRTSMFIDHPSYNLQLTGKEARALYQMLSKHYSLVKSPEQQD